MGGFYAGLYLAFHIGWARAYRYRQRLPNWKNTPRPLTRFSIVIAARNEALNIENLLTDLCAQAYPAAAFEVIVVDDHSADDTAERVAYFSRAHPALAVRLFRMSETSAAPGTAPTAYKKAALATGIHAARFEYILTTDADCRMTSQWLHAWHSQIALRPQIVAMSGPVALSPAPTLLMRIQQYEFLGLNAMAASLQGLARPILANGANMMFSKAIFAHVGGYANIDGVNSGDDELLMQKIALAYPGRTGFAMQSQAMVTTPPLAYLSELLAQRKRWVSKSRHYPGKRTGRLLGAVYIWNVLMALLILSLPFKPGLLNVVAVLLLVKWLSEWIYLKRVSRFYAMPLGWKTFLLGSFLHIFYTAFIGIYGNIGRYQWKGRELR